MSSENNIRTPKKIVHPHVLIILDGWGIGPDDYSNAIHLARTPHFDVYWKKYPHASLHASGEYVGLPKNQDGNSEAGHMCLGAGRVVEQDTTIISRSISDGTFFKNPAFIQAVKHANKYNSAVHLMGLLSDGQSAHSHPDHLIALISFFHTKGIKNIYLHLFTDGRDSHRYEAGKLLRKYHSAFRYCQIATISGRAYAMDRKKDWKNTKIAYDAMVLGKSPKTSSSADDAIVHAYNRGETDEFILPTVITNDGKPVATINSNDSVVFFNLRSDRARQLAKPFCQDNFEGLNKHSFIRLKKFQHLFFVAMTDFGPDLGNILTAFPSRDIIDTLPMVLKNVRQLYIAESEKYAHITFFFNGGYDQPIAGEDREMIPSPDVISYIKNPRMSLERLTKSVKAAIEKGEHGFIALNISNADMIAHTGSLQSTIQAIEYIDESLHMIVSAALKKNGTVYITADHGNAEELISRDNGEIDTEHSKSLVPFIIVSKRNNVVLRNTGSLSDVAPTVLDYMGRKKSSLMTGTSLIKKRR